MSKLLLLALLAAVVYFFWRAAARRNAQRRPRDGRSSAAVPERMVGCSQCGVNLPVSDAIEVRGRFFCSEEHRRLFVD